MQAQQTKSEDLVLCDEVADIRTREALAGGTTAVLAEWARVDSKSRVPQVEAPFPRERRARSRSSSGQDALARLARQPEEES